MIVPASVRRRFERDAVAIEKVKQKVWEAVSRFCQQKGYALAGRTKEFASLAEKLETGRYKCWSDLDDLYGCKIIVPTLADESEAMEFLERVFHRVRVSRRGSTKKWPDVFRFDSTRFVGQLKHPVVGDVPPECLISFEVQVITAFEHAWSTTTHALAYKSSDLDWKTRRIAAQLRASVEQLDMIVLSARTATGHIEASPCPDLEAQNAIAEGFQALIATGTIPEEMAPNTWSRFSENIHSLLGATHGNRRDGGMSVEELLEKCRTQAAGYPTAGFPRLVSLYQFVLGVIAKSEAIQWPVAKYTPLITPELSQVFPGVFDHAVGFSLET